MLLFFGHFGQREGSLVNVKSLDSSWAVICFELQ